MRLATWLATLAGAVTLGFVAVPAQAATADGLHAFKPAAAQSADVQKVNWYRRHHYRYDYYEPRHRYWRHRHYYRHHRHHRYW
jgi:hypothetical protein